ncbi:MAG: hypothetical protein GYA66_10810 [Phyllobacteriaceae bacterium]|nr:hypothetical protein [Phyllobacteriaceae bacterium]
MISRLMMSALLLAASVVAAEAKVETKTFSPPILGGARADACVKKGGACGQAGADKFCREVGYQKARKFSFESTSAQTVYPGSGATCTTGCKALVSVACMKDSKPTFSVAPLKPDEWGEVED